MVGGERDIRWQQRFANYSRALNQLTQAVELAKQRELTELEQQGLIKAFEFSYELAWNVMKDYFFYQGTPDITGSRDAIRESFARGLVVDGSGWMAMIKSRNKTSHTYNKQVAIEILTNVITNYHPLFLDFQQHMQGLMKKS